MQLSKETIEILKNFATINNSACFKKGQVQRTISPQKTILAQANFKEDVPRDFAIYDLGQFMSVLSLFSAPTIECGEKHLTIKEGKSTTTYFYAAPDNITAPSNKTITLDDVVAEFSLSAEALSQAVKAASVLGLPEIYVQGKDGEAYIGASDSRSKTTNAFEYPSGGTKANFRMVFKLENLKMMARNYNVKLSGRGVAHFISEDKGLEYWVPVDANANKPAAK